MTTTYLHPCIRSYLLLILYSFVHPITKNKCFQRTPFLTTTMSDELDSSPEVIPQQIPRRSASPFNAFPETHNNSLLLDRLTREQQASNSRQAALILGHIAESFISQEMSSDSEQETRITSQPTPKKNRFEVSFPSDQVPSLPSPPSTSHSDSPQPKNLWSA